MNTRTSRVLFHPWVNSTRNFFTTMIKSVFAAAAALSMTAGAAIAGPYVNIESNSGFTGTDYEGTVTETHLGYEGALGESAGYYVQAGPALVNADGEDLSTELSGKAGLSVEVTERVEVYGEISFITDDDANGYGTKVGATYRF